MKVFPMMFLAVVMSACATTNPQISNEQLMKELQAVRQDNADLRAKIEAQAQRRPSAQVMVPVQQQPVGMMVQQVPPPAKPPMPGPPQYFGWLHTTPQGCEKGPFRLELRNVTEYFVTVLLDGEEVRPRGSQGALPHLPPRTRAYICLSHLGEHTVAGVAYASRMGILAEVEKFNMPVYYDVNSMQAGIGQFTDISDRVLWKY